MKYTDCKNNWSSAIGFFALLILFLFGTTSYSQERKMNRPEDGRSKTVNSKDKQNQKRVDDVRPEGNEMEKTATAKKGREEMVVESRAIWINTEHISQPGNYQVSGAGLSGNYKTGKENRFLLATIPSGRKETIRLEAAKETGIEPLTILFDVDDKAGISHVRAVIMAENKEEIHPMDNAFYEVRKNKIYFLNGDKSVLEEEKEADVSISLENGLLMSPNGDNSYDLFEITGVEKVQNFQLRISDLKGNLMFVTENPSDHWNGKFQNKGSLVPKGTYQYTMNLEEQIISGQFLVDY